MSIYKKDHGKLTCVKVRKSTKLTHNEYYFSFILTHVLYMYTFFFLCNIFSIKSRVKCSGLIFITIFIIFSLSFVIYSTFTIIMLNDMSTSLSCNFTDISFMFICNFIFIFFKLL